MYPFKNKILYPVLLPVPSDIYENLTVRERVKFLSQQARLALIKSAQFSGVSEFQEGTVLSKNDNGAPLPVWGWHWSVTHKPKYVGGVISNMPAGLDIEKIRDVALSLFRKTATDEEWALMSQPVGLEDFFRCWTAKEAVLKASGMGLKGLSQCLIIKVLSKDHLHILFQNRIWMIQHFYFDGHLASIVQDNFQVHWNLLP